MKKKILIILSILLTIFSFSPITKASQNQPPGNLQEAQTLANQELYNQFGDYVGPNYFDSANTADKPLGWVQIGGLAGVTIGSSNNTYGALVYGDPHGDTNGDQSRYLGYTYNDEDYTNPAFPHDAWAGGYLEDRHWIPTPWDGTVSGVIPNHFDGNQNYLPNIQKGIATYYADVSKGGDSNYWDNWYQYVHILVPPTEYTWGMGRAWHQRDDCSIWYISVPLTPGAMVNTPELKVTPPSATVNVGDNQQYISTNYPKGQSAGNGQDVTSQSTWSSSDNSIASPASTPGVFNGVAPGTVTVTATFTTSDGTKLQGTAQLTVEELQPPPPPSTGGLTLQAISQDGSITRDPGTAKWTDLVTATLKLPVQSTVTREGHPNYSTTVAPPPPPGGGCNPDANRTYITSWSIEKADISYPKQNPQYTFNNPLPPVGKVTDSMTVAGHQATATFKELWAEDGAFIYDVLTDQLINQQPTKYDVTASGITVRVNYNIVKYHLVCDPDGGCFCEPSSTPASYTQELSPVTGQLLVDGTGVNSLAQ